MGKKGRNNKEIIPLELVQYHQYQKRISFTRARYFYASREKWLCYETKRQTGSFYRYSLISGLRRLGSPLRFSAHLRGVSVSVSAGISRS